MDLSGLSLVLIIGGAGLICVVLGLILLKQNIPPRPSNRPTPVSFPKSKSVFTPASPSAAISSAGVSVQPLPQARLSITSGSLGGSEMPIPATGVRIGRGSENDIILAEPMVSRHHAEIILKEGCHILYDCGSSNGTFVDGERIFERRLRSGDHFQIGFSDFIYRLDGIPSPPNPSSAFQPHVPRVAYQPTGSQEFEGYLIEGSIGGGGMAEVLRARASNGRLVAIKVPRITNDPYLMRKFEKEGNHIGMVLRGHPHIVEVERFAYTRSGTPYIVMEFVDGGSLREWIRRKMDADQICNIIAQTCLALGYAHHHQIVHRDIKPENILLTREGHVKVADFGIARLLSVVTVTNKGPIGTPEYMSPEQITGDNVLPASDIYSVGIVLYELLTGRVPFPRRTDIRDDVKQAMDVVDRHLREPPTPPHMFNTDIPPQLEQITMRALAKDARQRYQDGNEMAKALGAKPLLIDSKPIPTTARLAIIEGPYRGQSLLLSRESVEITRQQLDPANSAISRCHAVIYQRNNGYWLEDRSKNGTWVNNQRVFGEHLLSIGDQIRIGNCILRLEEEAQHKKPILTG